MQINCTRFVPRPHPRLKAEFDNLIKYIYGQGIGSIRQILADLGYQNLDINSSGSIIEMFKQDVDNHYFAIQVHSNGTGTIHRINDQHPVMRSLGNLVIGILKLVSGQLRAEDNSLRFEYQREVSHPYRQPQE